MVFDAEIENYDIPILFVCFNRIEIAKKSFEKIVQIKPKKIYIACDGAREFKTGEKEKVSQVRKEILKMITWDCEVKTLFQEKNLGCSKGVYTAINWLFSNEDKGIIIEDDCVPNKSFFIFMKEMLIKYKNDERIGMVEGCNLIKNIENGDSYCFTKFYNCCAWGTWKRAWKNMDLNLFFLNSIYKKDILQNMGYNAVLTKYYWKYRLKLIKLNEVSAWDWQWYFTLSSQNQLSILPSRSLVYNIGFNEEGTHTTGRVPARYLLSEEMDFPLVHPLYVVPNIDIEKETEKTMRNYMEILKWFLPIKLKNIIKKIVR